jgi:hypothetical protein
MAVAPQSPVSPLNGVVERDQAAQQRQRVEVDRPAAGALALAKAWEAWVASAGRLGAGVPLGIAIAVAFLRLHSPYIAPATRGGAACQSGSVRPADEARGRLARRSARGSPRPQRRCREYHDCLARLCRPRRLPSRVSVTRLLQAGPSTGWLEVGDSWATAGTPWARTIRMVWALRRAARIARKESASLCR